MGITVGSSGEEVPGRKVVTRDTMMMTKIISQQYIDTEASNAWLTNADLFAETQGFLTAIQDQVILIRNYKKYILKQPDTEELCSRCGKKSETIQHITAACEQLAPTEM